MDNDSFCLMTAYDKDGKRVELRVAHDAEEAFQTGKESVKFWGEGSTFKVWEAHEVKESNVTVQKD